MSIVLAVGNTGLFLGMIFGLLVVFFVGGDIYKLLTEVRQSTNIKERRKSIFHIILGVLVGGVGIYIFLLEYNLMTNSVYVEGTTTELCSRGKNGTGIEFEYYLDGKRYTNCNGYHDLKQIKIPGGKFKVRVSKFAPNLGRIDFDRPTSKDSKNY